MIDSITGEGESLQHVKFDCFLKQKKIDDKKNEEIILTNDMTATISIKWETNYESRIITNSKHNCGMLLKSK